LAEGVTVRAAVLSHEDKVLLTLAQLRVPIMPRPFLKLGECIGLTEAEVIARFRALKKAGFVRKIGPAIEPNALGLASDLVAAKVLPEWLDDVGLAVAAWPEVTHCYAREHEVNLWFAGVAAAPEWFGSAAAQVAEMKGVKGVWRLPTIRRFKLAVHFELAPIEEAKNRMPRVGNRTLEPHPPSPSPRAERGRQCKGTQSAGTRGEVPPTAQLLDSPSLLRAVQSDLPLTPEPFRELAEQNRLQPEQLIETLTALVDAGAVRRYGALVSHRRLGFTANAMVVMAVAPERIEAAGGRLAESPHVSHCYQRPPFAGFPYNLYAMVHGTNPQSCLDVAGELAGAVGEDDWQALFSTVEYRKSAPDYARLVEARDKTMTGESG